MSSHRPENTLPQIARENIKRILQWLAVSHGNEDFDDIEHLHQHLRLLRNTPLPGTQRLRLLDLLYCQAEKAVATELPRLREISLPISRRQRQRIRAALEMLSTLTQDYFNVLADLFDPENKAPPRTAQVALHRAMQCIAWHIRINHLAASPPDNGIWQQLHAAYRNARELGVEKTTGPRATDSIHRTYINTLLAAIAQPASFNAHELEFITEYIERHTPTPEISGQQSAHPSLFWIDPDKDTPAQAQTRRLAPETNTTLYFSCDKAAATADHYAKQLSRGATATQLGLPSFADTRAGRAVLKRLHALWGTPKKRRFPRRRQSYRTHLWAGLEALWHLTKEASSPSEYSEWMVTNESPDGYALMHVNGQTEHLRVGDIIAMQSTSSRIEKQPTWQICLVRWAISENPEHVEIGLQLIATKATAATITPAHDSDQDSSTALLLAATPPLRTNESLVIAAGKLSSEPSDLIALIEKDTPELRKLRTTSLDEQTASIEVFSLSPNVN
jgi:hypothetical protein